MTTTSSPKDPSSLPPEKVFSIQIGTELFRLSGASIASDAPSYFSQFFEDQIRKNDGDVSSLRTLYIDRDPCTFQEIARHLQGYHVRPRNGTHFVRLFADAQFYSLPRLTSQLFESDIFIQIGDRDFQIPRDIFNSPGNSPNFFSLGFAAFFASPSEVFPGLDRKGLLRPPAIEPPRVINRSGEVFAELLHMLRGYPLEIRSEEHRAQLLRDCRYFHLRGLEQQLIPHHISFHPDGPRTEIVMRLDDVKQTGLGILVIHSIGERDDPDNRRKDHERISLASYMRPFTEDQYNDLIVEIGDEQTIIDPRTMRAKFLGPPREQISCIFQQLAVKFRRALVPNSQTMGPCYTDDMQVYFDKDTDLTINGQSIRDAEQYTEAVIDEYDAAIQEERSTSLSTRPSKRRRVEEEQGPDRRRWIVQKGQWKLGVVQPTTEVDLLLVPVKLDVYTEEKVRNRARGFLSS